MKILTLLIQLFVFTCSLLLMTTASAVPGGINGKIKEVRVISGIEPTGILPRPYFLRHYILMEGVSTLGVCNTEKSDTGPEQLVAIYIQNNATEKEILPMLIAAKLNNTPVHIEIFDISTLEPNTTVTHCLLKWVSLL